MHMFWSIVVVIGLVLVVAGLVALIALSIAWTIDYGHFLKHLKLNHHEHWKAVGCPEQFEDEPQYGSFGFVEYFWGRRYAELGDSELTLLGDRVVSKQDLMPICILISAAGLILALFAAK